jgi:TRAP-type C4-dicarboxylate transport system substrate-binding protein
MKFSTVSDRILRAACVMAACLGMQLWVASALGHGVTLKVHHFLPADSPFQTQFLVPWTQKLEKESGGRLRFQFFPAMQGGGTPAQLYDQARDGGADIVWTAAAYTPDRFPAFQVFELPFLARTSQGSSRALWEYVQANDLGRKEFGDVRLLAVHQHSASQFHMVSKPIGSLADLSGARLRTPTRAASAFLAAAGATPTEMPITQVPELLSKGALDGVVTSWVAVPTLKLDALVKYHSTIVDGSPWLFSITFVLAMNPATYRGLPDDLKQVIRANSGAEPSAWVGKVYDDSTATVRKLAAERGAAINTLSVEEFARWHKPAQRVVDAWIADLDKRGLNGKELLDSARGSLAQFDSGK